MAAPKAKPKPKPVDRSTQGADMKQRIAALNKAGESYRTGKPISTPKTAAPAADKRPVAMPIRGDRVSKIEPGRLVDSPIDKRPVAMPVRGRMAPEGSAKSMPISKPPSMYEPRQPKSITSKAEPNARAVEKANANASFKRTASPSAKAQRTKLQGKVKKAMTKRTVGIKKGVINDSGLRRRVAPAIAKT